ncbi:hypothetical protein MTO96_046421 [Rhipicephalus appendiculatus]
MDDPDRYRPSEDAKAFAQATMPPPGAPPARPLRRSKHERTASFGGFFSGPAAQPNTLDTTGSQRQHPDLAGCGGRRCITWTSAGRTRFPPDSPCPANCKTTRQQPCCSQDCNYRRGRLPTLFLNLRRKRQWT